MISELKDISEFKLNAELKPIKRKANRADVEVYSINKIKAEKSFEICKDIIEKSGLDMRLINCEYTLDASKVIFMYTADERVDFRELLKKLASVFKCRIELRQVGPRDKAKIVGGLGTCGMPLCCNSFLGEFDGVSINMAKNQLLAINIDKISGACGRLLCCLKYEDEAYTDLKKKFPRIGTRTTFEGHHVKVTGLNVISGLVKFIDEDNSVRFVSLEEFNKNQGKEKREHRPPREEKKAINEEKGHAKKQSKQEKPFKKKPNKRKPHNKQNRNRKKENVKNESRSH
jgi:cell fate regulator YaaT (PSP1 superfamily)